jgi:DNA polymerase-3 subunit alpha
LERNNIEDAFDEIELLGFALCDPFTLVNATDLGNTTADKLMSKIKKPVTIMGYLVAKKDTSTKNGQPMYFGTFYDKHGKVFDTVHFPNISQQWPFRGRGFYFITGVVVEDFGIPMIEVITMDKVPFKNKRVADKLLLDW